MEGEMVKGLASIPNGWMILAGVYLFGQFIKEVFLTFRTIAGWILGKKNGNGNGNGYGSGYDPSTRAILGWLTTKGCDIHSGVQRGAASLGALLDISQQHLEATQEHTVEQRRRHVKLLEALAREQ